MLEKLLRIVETYPDNIACVVNEQKITYRELWDSSLLYADLLKKQGTSPVIIYGNKNINMVISIIACLIANRTYIPIDVCTPISRIERIITMSGSTLIIKNDILNIDNICCCTLDELIMFKDDKLNESKNDITYIIFTSGSTGDPKGVPISKNNLNNFINWISKLSPLENYKNVSVLNHASFSFDLSVADFYYSLCNGHTLVLLDKQSQEDYNEMFKIIKDNNITVAVMTPTFMKLCMLNSQFNKDNYPYLDCIYFCGELLETKLVKKIFSSFPNIKIINAYGPTEATSAVSGILITPEMTDKFELLPVGEVGNFATEISIVDEEIVLKGNSVFNGYLGNVYAGYYNDMGVNCYNTGDIGFIENGKLYCQGRKDSQIKYKGYRIELNDIENNINRIDGVIDCAVVAKYNDDNVVKLIKAFVVLEDGYSIDIVKSELKKLIPVYMMPNQIRAIDELPINCNQKIDRKLLSNL